MSSEIMLPTTWNKLVLENRSLIHHKKKKNNYPNPTLSHTSKCTYIDTI